MNEQAKASLTTASDSVKQIIMLATSLIGLEVTFAKDLLNQLGGAKYVAVVSWVLLLFSIILGISTMLALTGILATTSTFKSSDIYMKNVRVLAFAQIGFFILGLILTIIAGAFTVFS